MIAKVGLLAWAVLSAMAIDPMQTARLESLERVAIASRRSLDAGRCVFNVKWNVERRHSEFEREQRRVEILWSGQQCRQEVTSTNGELRVRSQNIEAPDLFVRVTGAPDDALLVESSTNQSSGMVRECMDPRRMGIVNWSVFSLQHFPMEDDLLNADRFEMSVSDITHDGNPAVKGTWSWSLPDSTGKGRSEFIYSAQAPFLPYRMTTRWSDPTTDVRHETTTEVAWREYSGVHFPQQLIFRTAENDVVLSEQVVETEHFEVLRDVPREEFSLAALTLPVGQRVIQDSREYFWTGSQLRTSPVSAPWQASRPTPWLIWVNAVALTVVAITLLWRSLRAARR